MQRLFYHASPGLHECHAVAFERLQDETFAAEQAAAEAPVEGDVDPGAQGGAQECIFLAGHPFLDLGQVQRNDVAGVGGGETDAPPPGPFVAEMGGKDRLSGKGALAGRKQLAHDTLARVRTIAHPGIEYDVLFHVGHRAGLGDHGLAGIQRDLHQLHLGADDLVVDFVTVHFLSSLVQAKPAGF